MRAAMGHRENAADIEYENAQRTTQSRSVERAQQRQDIAERRDTMREKTNTNTAGGVADKPAMRKGQMSCCGRHQNMSRYMETCLLVLLRDKADHGYSLAEKLGDFGFQDVNVSTLYRVMRRMEDSGWVSSAWASGGKGPQKRVYTITAGGRQALMEEIEVFQQRRQKIDILLAAYGQVAQSDIDGKAEST